MKLKSDTMIFIVPMLLILPLDKNGHNIITANYMEQRFSWDANNCYVKCSFSSTITEYFCFRSACDFLEIFLSSVESSDCSNVFRILFKEETIFICSLLKLFKPPFTFLSYSELKEGILYRDVCSRFPTFIKDSCPFWILGTLITVQSNTGLSSFKTLGSLTFVTHAAILNLARIKISFSLDQSL